MKRVHLFLLINVIFCALFLLLVIFDVSPFLRGPADWPPEWRWGYYYVNTWRKILAPLATFLVLVFSFFYLEKKPKLTLKHLLLLVLLGFFFHLSVLYFSRAGVFVLFGRIVKPDANGYFTAAIEVDNFFSLLDNYHYQILSFHQHARVHPPLALLPFFLLHQIFKKAPALTNLVLTQVPTPKGGIKIFWQDLTGAGQATAASATLLIPLLANLTLVPLFYFRAPMDIGARKDGRPAHPPTGGPSFHGRGGRHWSKNYFGEKTALRSLFLWILVPSVVLFLPLNDTFLPFFTCLGLWLASLNYANHRKTGGAQEARAPSWRAMKRAPAGGGNATGPVTYQFWGFLGGCVLGIGVLFSFSLLPVIFYLALETFWQHRSNWKTRLLSLFVGFIFPFLLLYLFFGFNIFTVAQVIFTGTAKRSYLPWLLWGPYDFFLFSGLALSFVFFYQLLIAPAGKAYLWALVVTLLVLDFSGATPAENGRVLLPLMPILVFVTNDFLTNKLKLTTSQFSLILFLLFAQIIILTEFWVTLW